MMIRKVILLALVLVLCRAGPPAWAGESAGHHKKPVAAAAQPSPASSTSNNAGLNHCLEAGCKWEMGGVSKGASCKAVCAGKPYGISCNAGERAVCQCASEPYASCAAGKS